jgi:hypothetical protein
MRIFLLEILHLVLMPEAGDAVDAANSRCYPAVTGYVSPGLIPTKARNYDRASTLSYEPPNLRQVVHRGPANTPDAPRS